MTVTLRQLRYFMAIAKSDSMAAAARKLNVAQPALSLQIKALEAELGVTLFSRHVKGASLTAEGRSLIPHAETVLHQVAQLKDNLSGAGSSPAGNVKVCIAMTLLGTIGPLLYETLRLRFPGIRIEFVEVLAAAARPLIESGAIDLGLLPNAGYIRNAKSVPIYRERFSLVFNPGVDGKPDGDIAFHEIEKFPLVCPGRDFDSRRTLENLAEANGCRLNVRYSINSGLFLRALVRNGLAFAAHPITEFMDDIANGSVEVREIENPEIFRVQSLVWPDRPKSRATEAIQDILIELLETLTATRRLPGEYLDPYCSADA